MCFWDIRLVSCVCLKSNFSTLFHHQFKYQKIPRGDSLYHILPKIMVEDESCSFVHKSIKRPYKFLSLLTGIQNPHYIAQSERTTNQHPNKTAFWSQLYYKTLHHLAVGKPGCCKMILLLLFLMYFIKVPKTSVTDHQCCSD